METGRTTSSGNKVITSACTLVTLLVTVTLASAKPWKHLLKGLTFFLAHSTSVCWQLSFYCLVKIPFKWMELSSENKQWEEIGGSAGVNTRPNYYSSSWREETPGCSQNDPPWREGCPLSKAGCFMLKWRCWNYLIYRNFKSQNGTDRWTCSRNDPWPQEVLSEQSRSKPISSLMWTAASESTLLKVRGRPRKNCWKLQLV